MINASSIVVLGGPAAGKTVFLTALYFHLWTGFEDLTIRASSGTMHTELLSAADQILDGNLPPATQSLRHYEFELTKGQRSYYIRFLDYPGELFRKVFYENLVDTDEARELYDLSTSADGVIVLADPNSVSDETWDIDYALSNLLRFYKTNGKQIPHFLLAFTKRDISEDLVGSKVSSFVRNNLPHLDAELGDGLRLQHFCSLVKRNGQLFFAQPETVAAPLRSLLEAIEGQQVTNERNAYLRRISWKRTAVRGLGVLLVFATIFFAFTGGVICRSHLLPPMTETSATL